MDKLKQCATIYQNLFEIQYKIILGRKGKTTTFTIGFEKKDFFHLIGLHKLKDLTYPSKNTEVIFDAIINDQITYDMISSSVHFKENKKKRYPGIELRIEYFLNISNILDSNNLVFKYNANRNNWSSVKAEYIFESRNYEKNIYLFIDKNKNDDIRFCRSFFPEMYSNYTNGQTKMTLLYKEKINIRCNESEIQLDKLSKDNSNNCK